MSDVSWPINVFNAAIEYHRAGFAVIPCAFGTKDAVVKWSRYQRERPTENDVRTWFASGKHQIALLSGDVSCGLAIRDFDRTEAYCEWANSYARLAADLPTVESYKGFHVWFRLPPEARRALQIAQNRDPDSGAIDLGDGELRAFSGCLTMAPPSVHPKGKPYTWVRPFLGKLSDVDLAAGGLVPPHFFVSPSVVSLHTESAESAGLLRQRKSEKAPWKPTSVGERGSEGDEQGKRLASSLQETSAPSSSQSFPRIFCAQIDNALSVAIATTVPTAPHDRNRQLFKFAREAKSIVPEATARALEPYFRRWHEMALPLMQPGSPARDYYSHLAEFERAFDGVKHLKGQEPIRLILEAALSGNPPECARQFDQDPKMPGFIAFLRELQRRTPNRPFFLDCRTAGDLFGVCPKTAWNWFDLLGRRKIIRRTKRGKRGKANEYRYLGD
jgi:hypothetical protein